MTRSRARALALAVLAPALLPGTARAGFVELGASLDMPRATCPQDCRAVTKTTAYASRLGAAVEPLTVAGRGRLVAFTVTLGDPTREQIGQFERSFGGPARIRLAVLRTVRRRPLVRRVVAQSQVIRPQPFFGTRATFALDRSLSVREGDTVALTVPTWLPALATSQPGTTRWRATRASNACGSETDSDPFFQQTAIERIGGQRTVGCTYAGARLTYSATIVTRAQAKYDGRHRPIRRP